MRGWLGVSVTALCLQAGCDSERTLTCADSIAHFCADSTHGCMLTWDQAGLGTALCAPTQAPPVGLDCGAYHLLTFPMAESARTSYYDVASGMLVAVVTASASSNTTTCNAGPAAGFRPPTCSGGGSALVLQCLDGGIDAPTGDGAATD